MVDRHGITRFEYGRTRAWWVRIYRGAADKKKCISKLFSDRSYFGGKRGALDAAKRWRDKTLKTLPSAQRGNVKPGYGYLRRVEVKRRVDWWPMWTAWLCVGHRKWMSTRWSIEAWGDKEARERCKLWLKRKRKELGLRAPTTR